MLHLWWRVKAHLAYPRLSLLLRSWIQDIEGTDAKDLCSTFSAKGRGAAPTGKVPLEGRREAGATGLQSLLNPDPVGCKGLSSHPHPSSLQAGPWEVGVSPQTCPRGVLSTAQREVGELGLLGYQAPCTRACASLAYRREAV